MAYFRFNLRALLAVLMVLLAALPTAAPAVAAVGVSSAAAPGLTPVHPGPHGYFYYTLAPGQAATARVVIHDLTGSPARYLVYVTGATTSPVGGVSYGQPVTPPSGVVAWFRPSETTVDLGPGGAAAAQVRVVVPLGAQPGEYVAAIAAQSSAPTVTTGRASGQRRFGFLVTSRAVVAVVVRVPGPMTPAATFGRPSVAAQQHRRQVLTIPVHDTGNQLMKPFLAGRVVACSGGKAVLRLARQLDTFVPRTTVDYPWYLSTVLPAGCYRVALDLSLAQNGARLARYRGTLQVGRAATRIRRAPPSPTAVARARLPGWLVPAAAGAGFLLLAALALLIRSRAERRRLLERLAASEDKEKQ